MSRRTADEAAAVATRRAAVGCWIEAGADGWCRVFWARLGPGGRLAVCASWFGPEAEGIEAAWAWASDQSAPAQGSSGRILARNEQAVMLALKIRRRRTESGV